MSNLPYVILIFAAFAGFIVSFNIFRKKRTKKPLVCPLKSDCNTVINSRFSSLLGIPLEIWGMIYYGLIAVSYGGIIAFPNLIHPSLLFVTLSLTTIGFLFSIYLTCVQAFAIRQWCVWCLTSAGLCTIIFFTTILGASYSLADILISHFEIILTAAMTGLALGIGGITIYNVFFIKFLQDLKISQSENEILKTISQIIWLAIFIFATAVLGLLPSLSDPSSANQIAVGVVILLVIITNESILNIFVAPKLIDISFGKRHAHEAGELHRLRQLSFVISITSLLSWYALLAISLISHLAFSQLLLIYLILIIIGFVFGLIGDKIIRGRHPVIS